MLKDSKRRLIIRGAHRDVKPVKSEISEAPKFKYTPMTNFKWNTQHMLVDTIPSDIVERNEVSLLKLIHLFRNTHMWHRGLRSSRIRSLSRSRECFNSLTKKNFLMALLRIKILSQKAKNSLTCFLMMKTFKSNMGKNLQSLPPASRKEIRHLRLRKKHHQITLMRNNNLQTMLPRLQELQA